MKSIELERYSKVNAENSTFDFGGIVGDRITANLEQWQLPVLSANPGMIQAFYDRDRKPRPNLQNCAGEFPGKHLTASVPHYRLTRDDRLRRVIEELVDHLAAVQDTDGYLGPFPREHRLVGTLGHGSPVWDVWGHYHCILGLILWYDESGSPKALDIAMRAADCICRRFLGTGERISDTAPGEWCGNSGPQGGNHAVIHGFCLLYERTGEQRYLDMAKEIVKDWETPGAGDWLRSALAGLEFYEMPAHRWENIHNIQALAELYHITGEEYYRRSFEHIWWSLLKGDRHNIGGFSTDESTLGNPYDPGMIETCGTVAWSALCVDMLRLSGLSIVADELELALYSGVLGYQSPSGRWSTVYSYMDGIKVPGDHVAHYPGIPSNPEITCCSVNAPRGLGLLSDWAVIRSEAGVWINYYGPCRVTTSTPSGGRLDLIQETTYPAGSSIRIQVSPVTPEEFPIHMRVPVWSENTRIYVNDSEVSGVISGTYVTTNRLWKQGDGVRIELDMRPHFWVGEQECEGKVSIYRGPILLAFDPTFNAIDVADIPEIDIESLELKPADTGKIPELVRPWMLFEAKATDGGSIYLSDFASTGWGGMPYRTWLPCRNGEPQEFSQANPLRSYRPHR